MNIKILIASLLFLIVSSAQSFAQNGNWKLFPTKDSAKAVRKTVSATDSISTELNFNQNQQGTLTLNQPTEIDSIIDFHKNNPYILGYTVQLEVSQQNSKIRDSRYKILKIQPDVHLEEVYMAPNTYLYGGVFYSRTDAYAFKHYIRESFPNAIVISRKMPLPPLEQTILKEEEK